MSLAEWIFSKIARLRGSSDAFRAQDSDPVESECVESVFGAYKNRKSENAQNRILDVRKFGQKVLKTDPRTLIVGFALKNYAQKWSQIVKTLDG